MWFIKFWRHLWINKRVQDSTVEIWRAGGRSGGRSYFWLLFYKNGRVPTHYKSCVLFSPHYPVIPPSLIYNMWNSNSNFTIDFSSLNDLLESPSRSTGPDHNPHKRRRVGNSQLTKSESTVNGNVQAATYHLRVKEGMTSEQLKDLEDFLNVCILTILPYTQRHI